jgi:Zn-dependent metalloprotease
VAPARPGRADAARAGKCARAFTVLLVSAITASQLLVPVSARGQAGPKATRHGEAPRTIAIPNVRVPKVVADYRERAGGVPERGRGLGKASQRPAWVSDALRVGLAQLKASPQTIGPVDPEAELQLTAALHDERGNTDVRLSQSHKGVGVFCGQLILHLDAEGTLRSVTGHLYGAAGLETTPLLDGATAVRQAKAALAYQGPFARQPVAELVILPEAVRTSRRTEPGARLTYRVSLLVGSGERAGDYEYFVDAKDGSVVWYYNNDRQAVGTANTYYSGSQSISTQELPDGKFCLRDPDRSNSEVRDADDLERDDPDFPADGIFVGEVGRNTWGDGGLTNRETMAADAAFGVQQSWDYFLDTHGRRGVDGDGVPTYTYVHYGTNHNNAYSRRRGDLNDVYLLDFGDGDGVDRGPYAALDVVGHEFTHHVVRTSAQLISAPLPRTVNEAMADIFGEAVEAFATGSCDYEHAADVNTPSVAGDGGTRSLATPPFDHLSKWVPFGNCADYEDSDCGAHENSTLISHAFYLMAEGKTNAVSGIAVPKIGRDNAEQIFYMALTRYLPQDADFEDVAYGTLNAAIALEQSSGQTGLRRSVLTAWRAVGVFKDDTPQPDTSRWNLFYYERYVRPVYEEVRPSSAAVGRIEDTFAHTTLAHYPEMFGNWSHVVGGSDEVFFYNADTGAGALGRVGSDGTFTNTASFGYRTFARGWTHIVQYRGSVLFYNRDTGAAVIGKVGPSGFTQYNRYTTFSPGFTHLVSVQGYLLFYNVYTGYAAVGTLDDVFGEGGLLIRIDYRDVNGGWYAPGWTQIVDTRRGVLFYNAGNGAYVVGDFDAAGGCGDRVPTAPIWMEPGSFPLWRYSALKTGWTDIVAAKDRLLFYDRATREGMTAFVYTAEQSTQWQNEPLAVQVTYPPGGFGRWTHIVAVAEPAPGP